MMFLGTEVRMTGQRFPESFLPPLLKIGAMFPFLHQQGLHLTAVTSRYGERLGNYISQFPQSLGCISGLTDFRFIQVRSGSPGVRNLD